MLNFKQDIAPLNGWLTEAEGTFLYTSAKKMDHTDVIVEIGSWKGKSTICIARGVVDGRPAKIYAIDPHIGSSEHQKMFGEVDTYEEFITNIKQASVSKYIKPIRKTSAVAAQNFKETIGFLFVDGAHEYRMVKIDIDSWFDKVRNGGTIAFHDSWHCLGPYLATAIMLLTSSRIKNPQLVDTITSFEKVKQNTLFDRANNILFLIYKTVFGWIGAFKLGMKDNLGALTNYNKKIRFN